MSIENSPGFRSAQAAWENANPFDGDCTCLDDDLFICAECGEDAKKEMDCTVCGGFIRQVSGDALIEEYPATDCPVHGYTDEDAADDAREHDRESRLGY
jgi:hypothetical protein